MYIQPTKMKRHNTSARTERLSTYFLSYFRVAEHFGHFSTSSFQSRAAPHWGQGRWASSMSMTGMSSLMGNTRPHSRLAQWSFSPSRRSSLLQKEHAMMSRSALGTGIGGTSRVRIRHKV